MTDSQLDLANCANEPIRVPGAIQPHGLLACLDATTGAVRAYSANWADLPECAGDVPAAIGRVLEGAPAVVAQLGGSEKLQRVGHVALGGFDFDIVAHGVGPRLIVELLPGDPPNANVEPPIHRMVQRLVAELQAARDVTQLAEAAAREIQRLTGYGRTLVYRFDAEGHGHVLAEFAEAGYASYLGLRFPASDIPPQARELYRLNHIRNIPTATYEPVPIVFVGAPPPTPLDLSFSALRSVSPVHLQYMRNMGTASSMSVSIMVRGLLWGLISCHDHAERHLSHATLLACEHLGQVLSLQIEAKEDNAEVADRLELRRVTLDLVAHLTDSDASLQQLTREPSSLLRMARASGAAVVLDERSWTVGRTPEPAQLQALAHWLAEKSDEVFGTDRLCTLYTDAAAYQAVASGLLAVSISRIHRHFILWFRPEVEQTIEWAGDPRKEAAVVDGRLHPRQSFSTWKEQVRGRALAWRPSEVSAAQELRHALIEIVLRRAQELAELANELGRVNKELEAFSYSVSHDLRAPMRHISGYVDMVLDLERPSLSERGLRYLGSVKDAAHFAGQLVDALLEFAHMGRAALHPAEVPTGELVDALVRELMSQHPERQVEWQVQHPLPGMWADPVLLQMILRNLLDNALKYSRDRDVARITVRAIGDDQRHGLEVADNGVGFNMKYVGKLFGVFQRLHTQEEFDGTGIGLANVRRIVERHGGEVRAHGEIGAGARFGFVLPKPELAQPVVRLDGEEADDAAPRHPAGSHR